MCAPRRSWLEPFTNPPGYNSLGANVAMLKAGGKRSGFVRDRHGNPVDHTTATFDQLMESATCFAGTPDDVYNQIKELNDRVGGFGHLLFFGQGGFLDHADTVANITLFGRRGLAAAARVEPGTGETRRRRRRAIGVRAGLPALIARSDATKRSRSSAFGPSRLLRFARTDFGAHNAHRS